MLPFEVTSQGRSPKLHVDAQGVARIVWVQPSEEGFNRAFLTVVDPELGRVDEVAITPADRDVATNWPEGPTIAVHDGRVAVGVGTAFRGDVEVHAMLADADTLAFEPVFTDALLPGDAQITFPTVAFDTGGELWFAWLVAPRQTGTLWLAHEAAGYTPVNVTDRLGPEPPCECCPIRLGTRADGDLFVAWRGDRQKDIFLAWGPPTDPVARQARATDSGVVNDVCPLDGPAVADVDGRFHLAWSDTSADALVYTTVEGPDGTFTTTPVAPDAPTPQARAKLAGNLSAPTTGDPTTGGPASGAVVAWDGALFGSDGYRYRRGDAEPAFLAGPTGPLFEVDLFTVGDAVFAVGADADGRVWLVDVP